MKRMMVLMILLNMAALVFAQNPGAHIREMTGTVELKVPGAVEWKDAKVGEPISEATIISTGFKSTAILAVGSSTLMVRPLTRMSLDLLIQRDETETINIGLNTGRVRAEVKAPAGNKTAFSVTTPTTTASVRGTVFEMDTVNIQVHEGEVSYALTGGGVGDLAPRPVTVSAGQESWVDTDTGKTVSPMAAAETKISLPALSGQKATSGSENNAKLESTRGSLVVDVDLIPDE